MKAIMISDKPKWVAKILNGEKTIEIRKTMPKCELPIDVYIYCTKEEKLFDDYPNMANGRFKHNNVYIGKYNLSGKVIAKFTLKEIRLAKYQPYVDKASKMANELTCLTDEELDKYLNKKDGYGWVIDDLEIFNKPKELSEFKSHKKNIVNTKINGMVFETELDNSLIKAPQSWCYVEIGK